MERPVPTDDVLPGRPGDLGPLISERPEECRECWGCVRVCPARAIRVVDRRSQIIAEKCVACGLCVIECGKGHAVRDDTGLVRALLDSGRPVVAVLATEFSAALHPMDPADVERSLERLGFYAVESTVLGEELVAHAYDTHLARGSGAPVLRSTCPVAVEWVRRFRPAFATALAPIVPPYVAQARLVKALYPEDTAVVYVSPCYARKDEAYDSQFEGAIDAAVDFTELRRMLTAHERTKRPRALPGSRRPGALKEVSLTDGFPRRVLADRDMTAVDIEVVRGLRGLDRLLAAVEAGESGPAIVDMLNCEGCIDGPAVNPGLSLFAKRNIESTRREAAASSAVSSAALLAHLPTVELLRSFNAAPVKVPAPDEAQLDTVLGEGEFLSRDQTIDCGACGYPTCVEHAEAIWRGDSSWEMCFPLQRRRFEASVTQLQESATLDHVTGLWNRRLLSERLAQEADRSCRYGTPLAVLMVDLDGFKGLNDTYGHVAGDTVLAAVGAALREQLRSTDLPARYGGDEFVVVLPETGKTEAFAVAEKLRASIAALEVTVERDGYTESVRITASVGVAAAGSNVREPSRLLEAADSALYQAKEGGRDQVRIALG